MSIESGRRLEAARKAAGFKSKTALARAVGVSQPTVTDWEKNGMEPNGQNLTKLCKLLGITPEHLLLGAPQSAPALTHPAPPAGSVQALPPTVDAEAWKALTPKTRALIEELAQGGITDDDIKVLQVMADRMKKP